MCWVKNKIKINLYSNIDLILKYIYVQYKNWEYTNLDIFSCV